MQFIDVIADVRRMLQDTNTNTALQRFSDTTLLGFGNQTLKRMAIIRPDLFSYIGEVPTVEGQVLQSMPSDSIRVMEIFQVKNGDSIRETNRETLDQTYPSWQNDDPGPTVNWMRHARNPNRFFIYPKAPTGQILIAEYAKAPQEYAIEEDIDVLPDVYFPVLLDGIIFLAESIDNEHVNSQRAQLFQQSFLQMLATSFQSRSATDTETAGADPKGVA
jgi:hypothetical protein